MKTIKLFTRKANPWQWPVAAVITLLLLPLFVPAQAYFSDHVKKLWATDPVFKVPESVFYDQGNDVLYVSNINGKPSEKDGNGFISKLSPDGKIERLEWVTGLNGPKGMNMKNGKLYVADIDRVAEIDVAKGKIIRFYDARNAKFLNDIAIDDKGNIYVTDTETGAIWMISGNFITEWIPSGVFDSPNGLYFYDGKLYVGTNGEIIAINPESKAQKMVARFDGSVDGLEIDKNGDFIFSDWNGKVRRLKPGGKPEVLFNTTHEKINAADIQLMDDPNILLVPTFFDNRVMAYQILD